MYTRDHNGEDADGNSAPERLEPAIGPCSTPLPVRFPIVSTLIISLYLIIFVYLYKV